MKRALIVAAILTAACQRGGEPRKSPPHSENTNTAPVPKPAESQARVPHNEPISRDLDAIRASGELKVLFTFNSTGYFVYRGETMGYEYELLNLFAHESKLQLKPIIVRNSKILFDKLNVGEGDVVAAQLAGTTNQTEVAMTDTLYEMAPVIVQRNPQSPAGVTPAVSTALAREQRETAPSSIQVRARLISTPNELAGQKVHVPQTSPFRGRLLELNEELSQDIDVVEVDESSDKLIQRLSEGEIAFTVAADNLAQLKRGEYTNLIVKPMIGPSQPIVWGLRRNAPQLLAALNPWIEAKRKSGLLGRAVSKIFSQSPGLHHALNESVSYRGNRYALAVRRVVSGVREVSRMGLAPHRGAGLPGITIQSGRSILGRRDRPDADHAENRAAVARESE